MKRTNLLCLLALLCGLNLMAQQPALRFAEGKFRIAQFTDIHWMPGSPKCDTTAATIRAVLRAERPQLAVLSGDVVTGDPATEGWKRIITLFEEEQMPFAVTMGNHDAEYLTKDSIYTLLLKSPWFVGEKGPKEIGGLGNCVVPILGTKGQADIQEADRHPQALLYLIDSNDYQPRKLLGHYDWVHFDQIAWYRNESRRYTALNGGQPLPAVAFFHIPLTEYDAVARHEECYGRFLEGAVASPDINSGLFASMVDKQEVMATFCGHDHDNDFIGLHLGMALGYGRVTGAEAYGELKRGARIIELYEGQRRFDSWITTPEGREEAWYYPSALNGVEERTMTYLPALQPQRPAAKLKPGVAYTYYEGKCKKVEQIAACRVVKRGVMPVPSIAEAAAEDHFAYEFRALIDIPQRGVYRFYTYSDDGSVLLIDGTKVVDNDGGHSARRAEGKVALEAGLHELTIHYFEDYMGQALEVGYSSRDIQETPLPASILFQP